MLSHIPNADLQRLAYAGRFAHKYQLLSVETWAKETLCKALATCTIDVYTDLLRFSKLSPFATL
jgi:hypothetical protein